MTNYKSLQHPKWECTYHVVFIPKYRKKLIYEELRKHLGQVLRRLAGQKESLIEDGLLPAGSRARARSRLPPKFSVAQVTGYINGKSAIHIARNFQRVGETLLDSTARYFSSTLRIPPRGGHPVRVPCRI